MLFKVCRLSRPSPGLFRQVLPQIPLQLSALRGLNLLFLVALDGCHVQQSTSSDQPQAENSGKREKESFTFFLLFFFLFMITQVKFGCIPSVGNYFTPFRIFQSSMTHLNSPKSSSPFMIFQNKFSFPLPTLSSAKPRVLAGEKTKTFLAQIH